MEDYKFQCLDCGQSLEASEEKLGQTIDCPACGSKIALPEPDFNDPVSSSDGTTRACPFCGEQIRKVAVKCKHCGEFLDGSRSRQKTDTPICQYCGATMSKTVISSGNCSGIMIAMIVFTVGIIITFAIPLIGWVIGPVICIGSLFMGGESRKVWKCTNCGSIVNRA